MIGSPQFAADLREELRVAGDHAYEVIGWLGPEGPSADGDGPEWLGSLEQLRGAVLVNHVDLIVVRGGPGVRPWSGPRREPLGAARRRPALTCRCG